MNRDAPLLSELARMSSEQRDRMLRELTSGPSNDTAIVAEIQSLERRYEMTSETMRARVRCGDLDTAGTARWLVLLDALGR
jgi:hypothetical protein